MANSSSRSIRISIWYDDEPFPERIFTPEDCPILFGRTAQNQNKLSKTPISLQKLFDLDEQSLTNISRDHFRIEFDKEKNQFAVVNQSRMGTPVSSGGISSGVIPTSIHGEGTHFLRDFAEIILLNHTGQTNEKILIKIEDQQGRRRSGNTTVPVAALPSTFETQKDKNALEQLNENLTLLKTAHIYGGSGTGKSDLLDELAEQENSDWQPTRNVAINLLIARIDGYLLNESHPFTWHRLLRDMLSGMNLALSRHRADDALQTSTKEFIENLDQNKADYPDGGLFDSLIDLLREVIAKTGLSPTFVLENFDEAYAQLEPQMLYQLYKVHNNSTIAGQIGIILVTRRSLAHLRDTNESYFIEQFNGLFKETQLGLTYLHPDAFHMTMASLVNPGIDEVASTSLYQLSGGHPVLARELYQRLFREDNLDNPALWPQSLRNPEWLKTLPLNSCRVIWHYLTEEERFVLSQWHQLDNRPTLDGPVIKQLMEQSIIDQSGNLFSPVFSDMIPYLFEHTADQAKQRRIHSTEQGLRIDAERERVYVDGQDVSEQLIGVLTGKVLFYLHQCNGNICTYADLYENCWDVDGQALDFGRDEEETVKRTVSRLVKLVDPKREHIINVRGTGYRFNAPRG
ncbi:MAG: hypothetical protein AAF702_16530 [Chloroflexota bacterium]